MKKEHIILSIDDIIINKLNPRVHEAKNVNMIKRSMKDVGIIDDLVVDENNVLLAGHGRLLALKDIGEKEVSVLRVQGLSEKQKLQYMIYSNRTTETSVWDSELLLHSVEEIMNIDNDFEVSVFEMPDFNEYFKQGEITIDINSPCEKKAKDDSVIIIGLAIKKSSTQYMELLGQLKEKANGKTIQFFIGKESIIK